MNGARIFLLVCILSSCFLGFNLGIRYVNIKNKSHAICDPLACEQDGLEFGVYRVVNVGGHVIDALPIGGKTDIMEKLDTSLLLGKKRMLKSGDQIECLFCQFSHDGKIPQAVKDAALVLDFENYGDPPGLVVSDKIHNHAKCVIMIRCCAPN
jgi:hypothetical protein